MVGVGGGVGQKPRALTLNALTASHSYVLAETAKKRTRPGASWNFKGLS